MRRPAADIDAALVDAHEARRIVERGLLLAAKCDLEQTTSAGYLLPPAAAYVLASALRCAAETRYSPADVVRMDLVRLAELLVIDEGEQA